MSAPTRPSAPPVPLEIWRDLLAAAAAFRAAQPWEWMDDMDIFALVDEQQRPWFPSVLGAAGQVFGLALYRGENGLRFLFETVLSCDDDVIPREAAFAQDALLLDWGAKKALAPEDLAMLAALGHAPRARERRAWPCFRSHAPGWFPWFLDEKEARDLARHTRALLACAELARRDPAFFVPCDENDRMLPTVSTAAALAGPLAPGQVEWRVWELPPPAAPAVPFEWAAVRALPQDNRAGLEFDIFHLSSPVADDRRPYFPRLALLADAESGYIYAMDTAGPERPWNELVVATWNKAWAAIKTRPAFIAVRHPEWVDSLRPLAEALGVDLVLRDELPRIAEARDSLERFQGR